MIWPSTTIGELCERTSQRDPSLRPEDEFTYVDISSVDKDSKLIVRPTQLLGKDAPSRARKEIRAGDILVSTVRPNLNSVALVPEELDGEIASTGFCVLRPKATIALSRYCFYWARTDIFVSYLVSRARGASYPAVTDQVVFSCPLPLPPPTEQRRIVEILDQAQQLVEKRHKADLLSEHVLSSLFVKIFGDPRSWTSPGNARPLRSFVSVASGGTPDTRNSDFWGGDIPWVSAKDMKCRMIVDTGDHITEDAIRESNLKLISPGAVLVVVRGMILARKIPLALAGVRLAINQDLKALILTDPTLTPDFLHTALEIQSPALLAKVGTAAHGTRRIETEDLLSIPILPPQPDAVVKFQAMADMVHRVSAAGRRATSHIDDLFRTLLQKAFSAELTARWREAHMKDVLAEMENHAKLLRTMSSDGLAPA